MRRALVGNPLLDAHTRSAGHGVDAKRERLLREYSFAVPTDEALTAISNASAGGVVELGAGVGYWAALLAARGTDVIAFDLHPPPSPTNMWFAGVTPWFEVRPGGEDVLDRYARRTLLLVWPTRDEEWAANAARRHHQAGGAALVFVGEGPGGRTGDDQLQALLGHYDRCLSCSLGVLDVPCICDISQRWERRVSVSLPHWDGYADDLHLYSRVDPPRPLTARPSRRWRRRR